MKEMFYLTTHSIHFIYCYMALSENGLWQGLVDLVLVVLVVVVVIVILIILQLLLVVIVVLATEDEEEE